MPAARGASSGGRWGSDRSPEPVESTVPPGEEDPPIRPLGASFDAEVAEVVEPVVASAQAEEVGGVGAPVVLPVDDVVDLQAAAALAPRDPAGPVAVLDHAAGAVRDGSLGPADRDRDSVAADDG